MWLQNLQFNIEEKQLKNGSLLPQDWKTGPMQFERWMNSCQVLNLPLTDVDIFSYVVGNVGPELPQWEKQINNVLSYKKIVGKICILQTPFLNTN